MNSPDFLFIDVPWLCMVFLLSIRLAVIFLMTPVMYGLPPMVRVSLIISLSLALAAGFSPVHLSAEFGAAAWIQAMLIEMILGATLALGVLLGFAVFSVAGALLDVQIGYGIAQVFDPVTRRQLPVLTSAFNQLAWILFFVLNGHHVLFRALVISVERFPPGRAWPMTNAMGPIFKQVAGMSSLGFVLVAPVVFCIFLVELGLSVVARNLPQMNMFVMEMPIKILVGLTALSFWTADFGSVTSRVYASIFQTWNEIFRGVQ